jgi:hypothetical protein
LYYADQTVNQQEASVQVQAGRGRRNKQFNENPLRFESSTKDAAQAACANPSTIRYSSDSVTYGYNGTPLAHGSLPSRINLLKVVLL